MYSFEQLQQKVIELIDNEEFFPQTTSLYEPIYYAMHQGGKRIRPLLTYLVADMFDVDLEKAKYPALAVELLHNFTLVHDDIMDLSPLRRGKPTLYQKYGTNKAILAGDVIYALAYNYLLKCDPDKVEALTKTLTSVLIDVCKGQTLDIDFEQSGDVTIKDYITMISFKTGILLAGALKLGAIVARTSKQDMNTLTELGLYIGIAFQLQDDMLDVWSDLQEFGKVAGTDIADNKKTIVYLLAEGKASQEDKEILHRLYGEQSVDVPQKVDKVKAIFEKYDVRADVENMINQYMQMAMKSLEKLSPESERKENMRTLIDKLLNRKK